MRAFRVSLRLEGVVRQGPRMPLPPLGSVLMMVDWLEVGWVSRVEAVSRKLGRKRRR